MKVVEKLGTGNGSTTMAKKRLLVPTFTILKQVFGLGIMKMGKQKKQESTQMV
jgi:hypothetical protein